MDAKPINLEHLRDQIHDEVTAKASKITDQLDTFKRRDGEIGLCFSCSEAWIYRTARQNDSTVLCTSQYDKVMTMAHDVVECSAYKEKGKLSLWQLVQSHKVVDLGVLTKSMGFKPQDEEVPG